MMNRYVRSALSVALVVSTVAACGSDEESTEAAAGNAQSSPISDFLGQEPFDPSNPEAAEAQFIAQERERQDLIAACMKEQGFDYIPMDMSEMISFGTGDDEFGSDEWLAKYGFGVSTLAFSQSQVGPDLVGHEDMMGDDGMFNDPNQEALDAMSDAEKEAYQSALYGDPTEMPAFPEDATDEEMEAASEDFVYEPQGCEGEAYAESDDQSMQFYQDFGDELTEMYERMQSDPRLQAVDDEVRECVTEKGLEYLPEIERYEVFGAEVSALREQMGFPGDDLSEEELSAMSEEELDDIFGVEPELTDAMKAELADIQEREIALAVAVDDCGGGYEENADLYLELQAEYEQQFLDEHADELADYQAS